MFHTKDTAMKLQSILNAGPRHVLFHYVRSFISSNIDLEFEYIYFYFTEFAGKSNDWNCILFYVLN